MLHSPNPSFLATREHASPTSEARRLRHEYNRLQRRIDALQGGEAAAVEIKGLKAQVERTARELGRVRAVSVHAIEAKVRVALDMRGETSEAAFNRLMSSALSDLHYLAMLTPPPIR